jgi:D-alanyl-D-alanine carboxypeptidase
MTMLDRIQQIHQRLGIPADYAQKRHLSLQTETSDLVNVAVNQQDRVFQLTPETAEAWENMRSSALRNGVTLLIGSAFRSIDYQTQLIEYRMTKGRSLIDILASMAAPGYSEHHTGQAIDIITLDSEPFTESFEVTPAFTWLKNNAGSFGFKLSFPRNNPYGFVYEPWHWRFHSKAPLT